MILCKYKIYNSEYLCSIYFVLYYIMKQNDKFLTTISKLHPRNNAINILKNIQNIPFFVYTIPKTGTSTLAISLQKMINNKSKYEHVVHCHQESCWKRIFNINFDFDLMSLIKIQRKKPIIFQLSRDPVKRLISFFFHIHRNIKNIKYTDLIKYLNERKKRVNYTYYQKKFDYNFNDLHYNYDDRCYIEEKDDYILFFMKLEDFNSYLKVNLIKYLNKYGYNFNNFHIHNTNEQRHVKNKFKDVICELDTKGIPNDICQAIFNSNKDEVNFFFTPDEIKEMEIKYNIKIN